MSGYEDASERLVSDPARPETWQTGDRFWRVVIGPAGNALAQMFRTETPAVGDRPPEGLVTEDQFICRGPRLPPGGGWHESRGDAWLTALLTSEAELRVATARHAAVRDAVRRLDIPVGGLVTVAVEAKDYPSPG